MICAWSFCGYMGWQTALSHAKRVGTWEGSPSMPPPARRVPAFPGPQRTTSVPSTRGSSGARRESTGLPLPRTSLLSALGGGGGEGDGKAAAALSG